jgi:hypothetical protein
VATPAEVAVITTASPTATLTATQRHLAILDPILLIRPGSGTIPPCCREAMRNRYVE